MNTLLRIFNSLFRRGKKAETLTLKVSTENYTPSDGILKLGNKPTVYSSHNNRRRTKGRNIQYVVDSFGRTKVIYH